MIGEFTQSDDIEEIQQENLQILNDIVALCNRKDIKRVENIFLLGQPGAGKSALINTLIKALTGVYIPKAKVGAGTTQTKTLTFERFESCGVSSEDIKSSNQRDIVDSILPKLPTIFDAGGMGDLECFEEYLELVIGGFIPPGTSMVALEHLQKQHGIGCFRDVFFTHSKDEWKITKVVFVQSCRETLYPERIECLNKILRKADPRTARRKYPAEVFVITTMCDLVKGSQHFDGIPIPNTEHVLSLEDLQEKENEIAKLFNIQGALKYNYIRWVSYTDRIKNDNPYIDNIALKFLKLMLTPGNRHNEPGSEVITSRKRMWLKLRKLKKEYVTWEQVLTYILMIVLSCFVYTIFTAKQVKP